MSFRPKSLQPNGTKWIVHELTYFRDVGVIFRKWNKREWHPAALKWQSSSACLCAKRCYVSEPWLAQHSFLYLNMNSIEGGCCVLCNITLYVTEWSPVCVFISGETMDESINFLVVTRWSIMWYYTKTNIIFSLCFTRKRGHFIGECQMYVKKQVSYLLTLCEGRAIMG